MGVYRIAPHIQAPIYPPDIRGYTRPRYMGGVLFGVASGITYSALHPTLALPSRRHRALQGKEVNHMDGAYYLRALVFIISCDSRERCVSCEK